MSSWTKPASTCSALLLSAACAATTPPPRFGSVSPADRTAPESAVPPPGPLLTGGGALSETADRVPAAEPAVPVADPHVGHGAADTRSDPAGETYTCPMHSETNSKTPGKCPICGMTLVKRTMKAKEPKP